MVSGPFGFPVLWRFAAARGGREKEKKKKKGEGCFAGCCWRGRKRKKKKGGGKWEVGCLLFYRPLTKHYGRRTRPARVVPSPYGRLPRREEKRKKREKGKRGRRGPSDIRSAGGGIVSFFLPLPGLRIQLNGEGEGRVGE